MNQPVTREQIMAQGRGEPASQATRIEQSRAVAEVQAAYTMAAARPRDPTKALNGVLESCRMRSVAEGAFFKFPRGGKSVQGETIHLAVEMARCWGNIIYSIAELERDDQRGISEMLATATDLETNTSSRTSFIVPHKRDKEGGSPAAPLTSMRDIYENNANMGARRLRECIFRVLPTWLVDAARAECFRTLENKEDQRPLTVRLADALSRFSDIGVSQARIEAKLGPVAAMTTVDLAGLGISYQSIRRGEITAEEEFPRVGVEETTATARKIADQVKGAGSEPAAEDHREGRDDTEMGEAHSDTAETDNSLEAVTARNIVAQANAVIDQQGLEDVEALSAKHRAVIAAHDHALMAFVDAAIDAAELRLKKKGKN